MDDGRFIHSRQQLRLPCKIWYGMSDLPKFCECLANLSGMNRQISNILNSNNLSGFYVGIVVNPIRIKLQRKDSI